MYLEWWHGHNSGKNRVLTTHCLSRTQCNDQNLIVNSHLQKTYTNVFESLDHQESGYMVKKKSVVTFSCFSNLKIFFCAQKFFQKFFFRFSRRIRQFQKFEKKIFFAKFLGPKISKKFFFQKCLKLPNSSRKKNFEIFLEFSKFFLCRGHDDRIFFWTYILTPDGPKISKWYILFLEVRVDD